jgi:hypothetical protein
MRPATSDAASAVTGASGPDEVPFPEAGESSLPNPSPDGGSGGSGRSRLWFPLRLAVAIVILGLIVVGLKVLSSSPRSRPSGSLGPVGQPTPGSIPSPTPAPTFAFAGRSVQSLALKQQTSRAAVSAAAQSVDTLLATFYLRTFLEPSAWSGGPPDEAWNLFLPSLRDRVRGQPGTFGLGDTGPDVKTLEATDSNLILRVLLDGSGHARAVFASVRFDATGTLKDGQTLDVANQATYLFRLTGKNWLISAYPSVRTTLDSAPAPSPTPMASGSSPTPSSSGGTP